MHIEVLARAAIAACAAALVVSCQSSSKAPSHAQIINELTMEAKVVAVDSATRELTIEGSDGVRVAVVAGPEVRNFDQINVGDTIKTSFQQSLTARRLEADEPDTEATAALVAGRAESGQKPGVGVGAGVVLTVTVESVDRDQHLVVLTGPDGELHAVRAQRETGQAFVDGLKAGDRVELSFGETAMVTIE